MNSLTQSTLREVDFKDIDVSIEMLSETISNEALGSLSGLMAATKKLPLLLGRVSQVMKVFSKDKLVKDRNVMQFTRDLKTHTYVELMNRQITVPLGMRTDYLQYSKTLKQAIVTMELSLNTQVEPFAAWLSGKIGEPSSFASLSTAKVDGYKFQNIDRELEKVQSCFDLKGVQHGKRVYKHVIKRNEDWRTVLADLNEMERVFSDQFHQHIQDRAAYLTSLLDACIQILEDGQAKPSSNVVKSLSQFSYECAKVVESYGLLRYRLRELELAVKAVEVEIR